jgi:hypothetical protein
VLSTGKWSKLSDFFSKIPSLMRMDRMILTKAGIKPGQRVLEIGEFSPANRYVLELMFM